MVRNWKLNCIFPPCFWRLHVQSVFLQEEHGHVFIERDMKACWELNPLYLIHLYWKSVIVFENKQKWKDEKL